MIKISDYLRNIFTMITGAFVAQLILILGSLAITRIYKPEDLGLIALFLSLVNIVSVISTGQFEHSIILPKRNKDAYNLIFYTCFLVLVVCGVCFILILPFKAEISNFLNQDNFDIWLYFLPIMVVLNAFFYVFRAWLIRKKKFNRITKGTVLKSVILNAIIITGGLYVANPIFFLIGNLAAQFSETVYLYIKIEKTKTDLSVVNAKVLLKEYKNFPTFLLPAELINTYTSQNPIILLNLFFGASTVGFFSLTQRVLGLPIKLISNTTREVFKQRATEEFNNYGNCRKSFGETFKLLFFVSLVPAIILYFLSPVLFSFFFGSDWVISGLYAKYLLIMFCFQFSVSPLSYVLFIRNKQKYDMYWQIGLLIFTTIGILVGVYFDSPDISIIGFSITYAFMYVVYLKLIYDASK